MNKLVVIAICLLLTACSTSKVMQVNYYLLNDSSSPEQHVQINGSSAKVVLHRIELAEYLLQSNLAMQINSHQLHYSRQHAWAEPLTSAISKALITDLNAEQSDFTYMTKNDPIATDHQYELRLQIDHLLATDKSTVIATGYYWLLTKGENNVTNLKKSFNLERKLTKDGYPHAVAQLRELIGQLSNQINRDISNLNE